MEFIKTAPDGKGFVTASGEKFVPLGFNYDRDYKLRLMEEYWDSEWPTIVSDFQEIKQLGANVVRVHLQFPKFMDGPNRPNKQSLRKLRQLLSLAEKTGLYLDLTGLGCYRKNDAPPWYENLDESSRWAAQANFWSAIAKCCAKSPAVFCYDLMNEPVVPAKKLEACGWLVGQLAGFYYVQAISLDPADRARSNIARDWITQMSREIRRHDKRHLITVGLLPNSAEATGSGFVPSKIAAELDFVSVHLYPRRGHLDEDLALLKTFQVGKPLLIEETMLTECSGSELLQFIKSSRGVACGWIGFYWGQTPEQLRASTQMVDVLMAEWLKVFQRIRHE